MTKWEMVHLPQRATSTLCEQFFAFVCQVEWGVSPAESAYLLGYKHLRTDGQPVEGRQMNGAKEERK